MPGSCVIPCLDAYTFRDLNGACTSCHPTCKSCIGPLDIDCLICKDINKAKYPK